MKIISFIILLLSFTAQAQVNRRELPRWQEEAIIRDIIHGDRCDSIRILQSKIIDGLNDQLYVQGNRIVKLNEIDSLRKLQMKYFTVTIANDETQILYWQREDKKHKRQRNLAVAVVVVAEVLKFIFTGKLL